jgi:hypothetical protein
MKRFIIAGILAIALSWGVSSTAVAQIVYGYTVPNAGGVVTGGTVLAPGGYRTFNNYFSPYTGVMSGQFYSTNVFGQAYGNSYGYNPWTGFSYRTGFYQPNFYIAPFGGYNYGYVRRWW